MNNIYLNNKSLFNIINVFTVTFDQFGASFLNKTIIIFLSPQTNGVLMNIVVFFYYIIIIILWLTKKCSLYWLINFTSHELNIPCVA